MSKVITVKRYSTKDYSIFEELPENREADKMRGHQRKIGESIQRHGFLDYRPLLVIKNGLGKFKVIDGQNRLREAKKLGSEVVYEIIDKYDNTLLVDLQAAKDWSSKDYMHNYVTIGTSESITYVNWLNGIYPKAPAPTIAGLLLGDLSSGSAIGIRAIKSGKVTMTYKDKTTDSLLLLKEIYESAIPERIKREVWKRAFVKAVYGLVRNGEFDKNILLEKIQTHHDKLLVHTRPHEWFDNLEQIYI